jgi:hypothetical protein
VSDLGISVQDLGVEAFNEVMAKRGQKRVGLSAPATGQVIR